MGQIYLEIKWAHKSLLRPAHYPKRKITAVELGSPVQTVEPNSTGGFFFLIPALLVMTASQSTGTPWADNPSLKRDPRDLEDHNFGVHDKSRFITIIIIILQADGGSHRHAQPMNRSGSHRRKRNGVQELPPTLFSTLNRFFL